MAEIEPEMNFCRRCGTKLVPKDEYVFTCERQHTIFDHTAPAAALLLFNSDGELLVIERAIDPGKGMLDFPGGYCDGPESLEDALAREVQEETGIAPDKYSTPEFVLSDIDPYTYDGETRGVLAAVFRARLTQSVTPTAGDDASVAGFVPLNDIDIDKVHFPTLRRALEVTRREQ